MDKANSSALVESYLLGDEERLGNYEEEYDEDHLPIQQTDRNRHEKKQEMFSLTLLAPERGELMLPNSATVPVEAPQPSKSFFERWFKRKQTAKKEQPVMNSLPNPKVVKINDLVYCVYNSNIMNVYKYSPEKKGNFRKVFEMIQTLTFKSDIMFVKGSVSRFLVGFSDQFHVYYLSNSKIEEKKNEVTLASIVGGGFDREHMLIITKTRFCKYQQNNQELKLVSDTPIDLNIPTIRFIDVLRDYENDTYFVIFYERKMVKYVTEGEYKLETETYTSDKQRMGDEFNIMEINGKSGQFTRYEIARVPEEGLFDLSKVFYLKKSTFLLSLYQQIVVIRKHFKKFIIVDNICVSSTRLTEDSKIGQLVLIDQEKLIYNDIEKICVYKFFFDSSRDALKLELVDDFKGVDENQFILYDGVLLTYKKTTTQVLFYFNINKIRRPGRKAPQNMTESLEYSEKEDDRNKLKFSVFGVAQLRPQERLIDMLQSKRSPNDIQDFKKRFKISNLEYYKSQWSVSKKSLNDIVNHLLEINDEKFIQKELDSILKAEPHTMSFLIKIEEKQIIRLKEALVNKLVKKEGTLQTVDLIEKLLESKMFLKKLKYLNEFEAYKLIDFIEIKKLRAVSLREEIKLLSCKGYERRLKNFLNYFKYLAIANFDDIFGFLMTNKDENEIESFLVNFYFILPEAVERSTVSCFFESKRQIETRDECRLWDDFNNEGSATETTLVVEGDVEKSSQSNTDKAETIESFIIEVLKPTQKEDESLEKTRRQLRQILVTFKESEWFKENAFKKHCMLSIDEDSLVVEFRKLKDYKVYNILFQFLYSTIKDSALRERIVQNLVELGRIPLSYRANIKIREKVYDHLRIKDIPKPYFLVLSQAEYFDKLLRLPKVGADNLVLVTVKDLYDRMAAPGFFEQRFGVFMNSKEITLETLISLLKQFHQMDSGYQVENQLFLQILLKAITKNLKLHNRQQTDEVLQLLWQKVELVDPNPEIGAKMMQGYCYFEYFASFQMDYTYAELIAEAPQTQKNRFLDQIIDKYCKGSYLNNIFEVQQELNKQSITIDISTPFGFFCSLVILARKMGFEIESKYLIESFIFGMFKNDRQEEMQQIKDQMFDIISKEDEPKTFFQEKIIQHVQQCFYTYSDITQLHEHVQKCLALVDPPTIRTKQEMAYLELCTEIHSLQPELLKKFDLRTEIKSRPMIFLMKLLYACDQKILELKDSAETEKHFQYIYEKMVDATSEDIDGNTRAEMSTEFLEFEVERGFYYLSKNNISHALAICRSLSTQNDIYYHDLIYSIVCNISKTLDPAVGELSDAATVLVNYAIHCDEFDMAAKEPVIVTVLRELSVMTKVDKISYVKRLEKSLKAHKPIANTIKAEHNVLDSVLQQCFEFVLRQALGPKISTASYYTFVSLLEHNSIEAFYFLTKCKQLKLERVVDIIQSRFNSKRKDSKITLQFVGKYFSLAIYIRSLAEVVENFYPTHSFFRFKEAHLSEDRTRRDINILIAKLKLIEEKQKDRLQIRISEVLMKYYSYYMKEQGIEATIDLTEVNVEEEKLDSGNYAGYASYANYDNRQINKEELRLRQELLEYKQKVKTLLNQQVPPVKNDVIEPRIVSPPTIQLNPTATAKIDLPSQKYEKYEEVKTRQLKALKKMEKESIKAGKAEINEEVERIIEKFRLQRAERQSQKNPAIDNDDARSVAASEFELRSQKGFNAQNRNLLAGVINASFNNKEDPLKIMNGRFEKKPNPAEVSFTGNITNAGKTVRPIVESRIPPVQPSTKINVPMFDKKAPDFDIRSVKRYAPMPAEREKPLTVISPEKQYSVASVNVQKIKDRMEAFSKTVSQPSSPAMTLADLKEQLTRDQELEVVRDLQRFEMVRQNIVLGKELIKKAFNAGRNFKNMLKMIEVLYRTIPNYDKILESRALKIVSQAIKIDSKVQPKQLFDFGFFSDCKPSLTEQEYYGYAFNKIKPILIKILDDTNVHSLAKSMLYGFGMDKKYEHQVYKIFMDIRLQEFANKRMDEKQIFNIIQKIKTTYSKLPPDTRHRDIEELFSGKFNASKDSRQRLVQLVQTFDEAVQRTMKLRSNMVSEDEQELLKILKRLL